MKSRKKLSAPLSAAIAFLLFLSVIFAAESLTSALTLRLDMTEDGLYTLSDTTVDVLSHLSAPVTVTVFSNETDFVPLVHETLLRYQALSDQMVSIRYVDPYTHPSEVKRWQNQGFTITARWPLKGNSPPRSSSWKTCSSRMAKPSRRCKLSSR